MEKAVGKQLMLERGLSTFEEFGFFWHFGSIWHFLALFFLILAGCGNILLGVHTVLQQMGIQTMQQSEKQPANSCKNSLQAAATEFVCRRCTKGPQSRQNDAVQRNGHDIGNGDVPGKCVGVLLLGWYVERNGADSVDKMRMGEVQRGVSGPSWLSKKRRSNWKVTWKELCSKLAAWCMEVRHGQWRRDMNRCWRGRIYLRMG